MSRAERREIPPRPRLTRALREAASDFYYNSWRFLAANLIFGVILIGILIAFTINALAAVFAIALALPAAGCMRMATTMVRDRNTDFGDFLEIIRRPWHVIGLAAAQLGLVLVLLVDLSAGAQLGSFVGSFLTVSALYGLLLLWIYALVAWPIILDPERDADRLLARMRVAGMLLVAHPLRMAGFALLVGAILIVSTILIAAIVTFALAGSFLLAAHYVLPAADRVEGRATLEVGD